MINHDDVFRKLMDQLVALSTTYSIFYPNVEENAPPPPYYEVRYVPGSTTGQTLAGNEGRLRINGSVSIVLTSALGVGESPNLDEADLLTATFYMGAAWTITGGKVTITDVPDVRPSFRDGTEWRTPVNIPFNAVAT